jgi:anti-anti-sigma regulatory factor
MGARLRIEVEENSVLSFIRLSGVVDEDNDLAESLPRINRSTVFINSASVERINSCGVRDWVNWLGELGKKGAAIYLVECSPAIMSQANLVHNFFSSGQIVSYFAPFYCDTCDMDKMLLLTVAETKAQRPYPELTCRCDTCDHLMEFDDLEVSFFSFLGAAEVPQIPPAVLAALEELSPTATPPKLRLRGPSAPLVTVEANATAGVISKFTPTMPDRAQASSNSRLSFSTKTKEQPAPPPVVRSYKKGLGAILAIIVLGAGLLVYALLRQT